MSTTAQNVYDEVTSLLLEDGGFQFVYTQAGFLKDLSVSLAEFLQATGICKEFYPITLTPGQGTYTLPVTGMDVQAVWINGVFIQANSSFYLDHANPSWELDGSIQTQWKQDQLDANTIQIVPSPTVSGTMTVLATAQPTNTSLALGSTLELIPDSLAPYLTYMCSQKIFEADGESKDVQRARYCSTRRVEGVNLAKAVVAEDLLERQ